MSLKDKLLRMKTHLSIGLNEATVARLDTLFIPHQNSWAEIQTLPYVLDEDYIMVREVRFPLAYAHGAYRFAMLPEIIEQWLQSGLHHPLSAANQSATDLLFFDTETTGLHGGVGNTIFLLGQCRYEGDSVVMKQYFLPAPESESTLYYAFLSELNGISHLVTYNGKSFDWPQVKTRHTLMRGSVPDLPKLGHFDLLHGARRLWRDDLESCRLALIEPAKLNITRADDIPGFLAPILYFDYLQSRDPTIIQGVLRHNETDVLSLITLYIHISTLLIHYQSAHVGSHEERFQIARWYEALGHDEPALNGYAVIAASDHALRGKAKVALGHIYKRQKQWSRAICMWEENILEQGEVAEEVYIELAKVYEHQVKDFEKALHYTLSAWESCKRRSTLLRRPKLSEQQAYAHRILRLEHKLGLTSSL